MTKSYRRKLESSEIVRKLFLPSTDIHLCELHQTIMPSAPSNLPSCLPLFFLSRSHCPFYFSQLCQQWAKQRAKSWRNFVFGGIFGNSPHHFSLILQSSLVQVLFFSAPTPTWLTKCNKITQISKPRSDLGALKLTAAPQKTKILLQSFFYARFIFLVFLFAYTVSRWWGGSARVAVSDQKQIIPSKSNKVELRMSNPFQHVCETWFDDLNLHLHCIFRIFNSRKRE